MFSKHSNKMLVVGLVLAIGLVFGASVISADEPVRPVAVVADDAGNDIYATFADGSGEGTTCRRSDCPCGASWGDCQEDPWGCWCRCDPCDAERAGSLGYVYAIHHSWGVSYGRSVLGQAWVGFWGDNYPGNYAEYRAWTTVPLGGLPEREVEKATLILDVDTTWLATDENTSLVVELIDIGSWQPRVYYELDYPLTVAELLRLTTGEIKEMVEYYEEPLRIDVSPALLDERIGKYFTVRFLMRGAPANNLSVIKGAELFIRFRQPD